MKTKIQNKGLILGMGMLLTTSSFGQLNEDFISKFSYKETTTVVYEMFGPTNEMQLQAIQSGAMLPSPTGRDCLTLIELSKYHNYNQIHTITEWFDMDRDHLLEKVLISEENVRDNWMTPFSKMILGKYNYEIFGPNDELLYTFPKEDFTNSTYDSLVPEMTNEMAVNYMSVNMGDSFLIEMSQLIYSLSPDLDSFHVDQHGVFFSEDSVDTRYDHDLKIVFVREYNSDRSAVKSEKITMYEPINNEISLYPAIEVSIDYMLTENNCCLRKITTVSRDNFTKEIHPDFTYLVTFPEVNNPENQTKIQKENLQLSNIPGTNNFLIQTDNPNSEFFQVQLYDLNGKYLKTYSAISGTPFTCVGISTGVYLARIHDMNGNIKSTEKIIIQNSQFNH